MAKKLKGQDGNPATGEEEEESDSSEETTEDDTPPTDEEVAATKKKEEADAKLRKEIEADILTDIAKKKAAKKLKEQDEKETVPESIKEYSDALRKQLGDDYPTNFNDLKIRTRTIAMLGLIEMREKTKKNIPIDKGKSTIPKPKTEKGVSTKRKMTAANSYKERAKGYSWMQ